MMEYKIVTAEHAIDLEKKVRENISAGWIPQGGVSMILNSGGMMYSTKEYYQAMVRKK
jgi:hypothetical protein